MAHARAREGREGGKQSEASQVAISTAIPPGERLRWPPLRPGRAPYAVEVLRWVQVQGWPLPRRGVASGVDKSTDQAGEGQYSSVVRQVGNLKCARCHAEKVSVVNRRQIGLRRPKKGAF